MKDYAFNKLDSALLLRGGWINLAPQKWTPVKAEDVLLGTFDIVVKAGQVVLDKFDVEPESEVKAPLETIKSVSVDPGLSEEQLKEFLDKKAAEPPKFAGKVTMLGQDQGIKPEELEGSLTPPVKEVAPVEPPAETVTPTEVMPELAAKRVRKVKVAAEANEVPASETPPEA